jgi:hypothetical protein
MKNFFDVLFKYGDNKDFDKQHLVSNMINSFKILFSLIKTIIEKNEEEKINLLRFYILNEFQTRSKQVLLPKRR